MPCVAFPAGYKITNGGSGKSLRKISKFFLESLDSRARGLFTVFMPGTETGEPCASNALIDAATFERAIVGVGASTKKKPPPEGSGFVWSQT